MKFTNKVLGFSLAALVGFATSSFADDVKGSGKKSLESRIAELEAKLKDAGVGGGVKGSGIKISGYVDTSYIVNLSDRDNTGPVAGASAQNTGRVFDRHYDSFNVNAVKLTIEKGKDTSKFPAGFRVDGIVGSDANVFDGSGTANNDSKVFLEQAYINLGVPLGNGVDVKVGKMVSLIGYEVAESPANWQFSRSDAFRLAPITQAGVTAGYQWNDWLTTTVGLINGYDNFQIATGGIAGAGNFNTSLAFVGRANVTGPKTSFGDFNGFLAGFYGSEDTGTSTTLNHPESSIIDFGITWNKPFEVKPLGLGVEYLYRHDDISMAAAAANTQTVLQPAGASSTSIYGKWDWNKWTTSSARFSYSQYDNPRGSAIGVNNGLGPLVVPVAGFNPSDTDMYTVTLTQAFNVWKDTLLRLEWRHDWTDTPSVGFGAANATAGAAQNDIRQEQDTLAVNVVYSF